MSKLKKYLYFIFIIPLILLILFLNIRFYTLKFSDNEIVKQLNFLENELKNNNLANKMQTLFPEGYVFINALYGITCCQYVENYSTDLNQKEKLINEAQWSYNQLKNEEAFKMFDKNTNPPKGIFYNGWKNYLLGKIIQNSDTNILDKSILDEFKQNSEIIAEAFSANESPFLESYSGSSWPADSHVAIASLVIYNNIFNNKYSDIVQNWVKKVKLNLDEKTGLIPHYTDLDGETVTGTRGCSIVLSLIFLSEIDTEFAVGQFNIFKELFVDKKFGFYAIREYPIGISGFGDIDSGPVIFDVGFSATIVSLGVFNKFNESDFVNNFYIPINVFGFSFENKNTKKYLFGKLPVADAFIAWCMSMKPDDEMNTYKSENEIVFKNNLLLIHLISAFFIIIFLFPLFRKIYRK
jgi:hypothetical protein